MTEEVKESTRDPCEINTFSALGSDVYTGQLIRRPDVLKGGGCSICSYQYSVKSLNRNEAAADHRAGKTHDQRTQTRPAVPTPL